MNWMYWLTVSHIFSNASSCLCANIIPKNRKTTCNMGLALKTMYQSSLLFASGMNMRYSDDLYIKPLALFEFSAIWIFQYSLTFSCALFQEKLPHRNSDFHATEDNWGITRRAKRSPGKQLETGMSSVTHLLCPLSLHLDTEVVCWHLRLYCLPFLIFQAHTPNLVHWMTRKALQTIALWSCISFLFWICASQWPGWLLSNGFCNFYLFGGDWVQCK